MHWISLLEVVCKQTLPLYLSHFLEINKRIFCVQKHHMLNTIFFVLPCNAVLFLSNPLILKSDKVFWDIVHKIFNNIHKGLIGIDCVSTPHERDIIGDKMTLRLLSFEQVWLVLSEVTSIRREMLEWRIIARTPSNGKWRVVTVHDGIMINIMIYDEDQPS